MFKKNFITFFLWVLLWGVCSAQEICPLNAKPPAELKSLKEFSAIAILHNGRVKPMDTYARHVLLQFSGKGKYEKQEPIRWLTGVLFGNPELLEQKVFLINNPEIAETLGIEPEKGRRYSFAQLEKGLPLLIDLAQRAWDIDEKNRSIVENEIIRVESNIRLFIQLTHVFQFAAPHPDFQIQNKTLKKELEFPEAQNYFNFLMVALRAEKLNELTRDLENKENSLWTETEKEAYQLISNLYSWSMYYNNLPIHIIPFFQHETHDWLSPWDTIHFSFNDPDIRKEIYFLSDMYQAKLGGDQIRFDLAVRSFSNSVENRLKREGAGSKYLRLELFSNQLQAFFWAKFLYLFSFLICMMALIKTNKVFYRVAWILVGGGFLIQAIGFIMRVVILQRPPVSTLYETFLFVSFISVFVGLIIERFSKNWLGLIISSISGFVFLMIASRFAAEGDTLKMLVAVLNSNFWLSTHVVTITIGYAGVCVAGVVGHIYILQSIFRPHQQELLKETQRILLGTLAFGLTMTFLGTNLGGIWADASWGRFWGWDPKENGALLIVLWIAMLFHLKVGRMIGALGLAIGSVLGCIVVMWAWFGVNLLSVGLHSYGFTSGLARNLLIYVLVQLLFLTLTIPLIKRK
ncbi:MAG: cytochrome c biogenesis protein CcsA [Candidatus Omnitrophica bacterium]|nr:cytochrome c biogenesis protein CcsA [Candidatus Omnitrophota bacterium]